MLNLLQTVVCPAYGISNMIAQFTLVEALVIAWGTKRLLLVDHQNWTKSDFVICIFQQVACQNTQHSQITISSDSM